MKNDKDYRNVLLWFFSFIPFGAMIILFVFCFLYDTEPILYLFCALSLASFVVMFVPADKRIRHPDGYTLVQAMLFVLNCQKNGIHNANDNHEWRKVTKEAKNHTYAKDLNHAQLKDMYQLGDALVNKFQVLRK